MIHFYSNVNTKKMQVKWSVFFFLKTLSLSLCQYFQKLTPYTLAKFSALFFILPKHYIFLYIKLRYYFLTRLRRSKIIIMTNKIIIITSNNNTISIIHLETPLC